MSDIDVREIKLNLRYPNSRQEDITDAFMRGYQGAVKIGNDAVRRVKAEKETLIRRIDELCAENERLRERLKESDDGRMRQADNLIDKYHKIARLQTENAKLRELVSGLEYCAQGHVCDCCPLYDPSGTNHHRCESLERELGIEVTE